MLPKQKRARHSILKGKNRMPQVTFNLPITVTDGKAVMDVAALSPDVVAALINMANGKAANASGRVNLVFAQSYVGAPVASRPTDKVNFPLIQLAIYSSSNLDELGQAEKRLARRESMLAADRAKIANIKMAQVPAPVVAVPVKCSACGSNPATVARVNERGKAYRLCARCAKRIVK
jgi:hypothetical protein